MTKRGALRQAVDLSLEQLLVIYLNNRHLAEWRLLLSTQIVMVIPNTWKVSVMGMHITSFRSMMANRLRYGSAPLTLSSFYIISTPEGMVNCIE